MKLEIEKMALGDTVTLEDGTDILRVPNGWIFKFYQVSYDLTTDGTWHENYQLSTQYVPEELNCWIKNG